jgi:hypothetical protein
MAGVLIQVIQSGESMKLSAPLCKTPDGESFAEAIQQFQNRLFIKFTIRLDAAQIDLPGSVITDIAHMYTRIIRSGLRLRKGRRFRLRSGAKSQTRFFTGATTRPPCYTPARWWILLAQ